VKDAQFNIFTVSDVQSDPAEIETSSVFSKLIEFFKPKRRSGAIGYSVGKTSLVDANGKISSTDSQVDVYLDGGHMTHIKDRHIILDATFPNNKEGKSTMWPPRDKIIGPSGEHFTDSVSGIFEWIKYALKSGSARYDKNTNLNIQNAPIRVEVVVENAIVSDGPWTAPKGYESYYDKGSLNQPTNGVKVVLEYNRNDKSWNIVSAYPITGPTKIK
jgi:hypothetical protein